MSRYLKKKHKKQHDINLTEACSYISYRMQCSVSVDNNVCNNQYKVEKFNQ